VTYPDDRVAAHVTEHFVPAKLLGAEHRELSKAFNIRWFPGLVVAGSDGRAAHVQVGYLPPDDLIAELDYGRAIHAMTAKNYAAANALFDALSADAATERGPEAAYWWGVSRMRETKDSKSALDPWRRIAQRWPKSQWARKVAYALK